MSSQTQISSQEDEITSSYLEQTIKQTSIIGHTEIEEFMEVQELIKDYANSVTSYNETIDVINQNLSLAKAQQEILQLRHLKLL